MVSAGLVVLTDAAPWVGSVTGTLTVISRTSPGCATLGLDLNADSNSLAVI